MKTQLSILILLICLIAVSCSIDNSMYNARQYFATAQNRPLGSNGRPSAQAIADYTKVIEKCGFILTERKHSREADDALFLLARALYYKGNAAFQARDQFASLIANFPDSPFVPEAYLYLAKVTREINRPDEAEKILAEFIRLPQYNRYHPRALLLLADLEIKNNDYLAAQYWLEKIITDYKRTPQYDEAFFLLGKNYFEQKDYERSLADFFKFYELRGISKDLRLDALYYIALNQLALGQLDAGYRQVQSLTAKELRTSKLADARVLKARYLIALGREDEGKAEFEDIAKTYPRTSSSADALYYLAEFLYLQKGNRSDAITNYNRVRSEFTTSTFASIAMGKANALTQLNQGAGLRLETNFQAFLDYHYLAADNFQVHFHLPDSSVVYYNRVIQESERLIAVRDSLSFHLPYLKAELDSITVILGEPAIVTAPENKGGSEEQSKQDEYSVEDGKDHEVMPPDTPDGEEDPEPDQTEDKDKEENQPPEEPRPDDPLRTRQQTLDSEISSMQQRLDQLNPVVEQIQAEHLPFAFFVKASVLHKHRRLREGLEPLYDTMTRLFPNHKYGNAVRQMLLDQPVRIIDPNEEEKEHRYDLALGYASSDPDSMLVLLCDLLDSPYPAIKARANFRLGWFYTFESLDSVRAVQYLSEALRLSSAGVYADLIRRFYDGNAFVITLGGEAVAVDSIATDSPAGDKDAVDEEVQPILPDSVKVEQLDDLNTPQFLDPSHSRRSYDVRFPKLLPFPQKPAD